MLSGKNFNLRHLHAYIEVCDGGSITKASVAVNLSQPAVTHAISKLELGLDSVLFFRSSKGMLPSDHGFIFLKRVKKALDILAEGINLAIKSSKNGRFDGIITNITTTQLKTLIAIGNQGSYAMAAGANGTSQPSLLRTAKELEHILGFSLYTKRSRGTGLTTAAQHVRRAAKLMFRELDKGIEEILSAKGIHNGRLMIGSLPLSRSRILPDAIDLLLNEFPEAKIGVVDGPYDDLLTGLRFGDLDIIIGAMRDPNPSNDIKQIKLFEDHLGVFSHPDFYGTLSKSSFEILQQKTWIVPKVGTPTRTYFDQFFQNKGMTSPEKLIETSSLILLRGLLKSKDRLAVLSSSQAKEEARLGTMKEHSINLQDRPRSIGFSILKDWQPTTIQKRFMEIIYKKTSVIK
ncbi:MAG: transcriptional regulator [Rhodobacteraceae bacterium]|nr:MAG: transcriptional regulator [Paracoccaceae bacterium]